MGKKDFFGRQAENRKIVLRVAMVGIIVNIILTVSKMVTGLLFDNLSVISDAIHSASDLVTSLFLIIAVFISSPKRDKKHNYGHEKVESLFVLFFAIVLAGVAALLFLQGVEGIMSPQAPDVNWYLISVIVLSLVAKEALFWYGMYYAKKTNSDMLRADAWHSRSDSLSSVAVLIGLICSMFMSTNIVESIAVLIVSVMILKVAFDIFRPAINQLIDKAADEKTSARIKQITEGVSGVEVVNTLRTRLFGNSIFVDIEIAVDGKLIVDKAHKVAKSVHDTLEDTEDLRIKHCTVSIVPYDAKSD